VTAFDDGIWSGHLTAADVCFMVAVILFAIAAAVCYRPMGSPEQRQLPVAAGLAAMALGLMLL
jgi:hypothetical protein